jgi:hypothetical protein
MKKSSKGKASSAAVALGQPSPLASNSNSKTPSRNGNRFIAA